MDNRYVVRDDLLNQIRAAFKARRSDYSQKRAAYDDRCTDLQEKIERLAKDRFMGCSQQMLDEAVWLVHYTDDWARAEDQIARTAASLEQPDQERARTAHRTRHDRWSFSRERFDLARRF